MRRKTMLLVMATILGCALAGCRSHEVKVANIQKQYDDMGNQFQKDCSAEMLNLPQKLSPKCADEKQKLADAWNRLQAERAKK